MPLLQPAVFPRNVVTNRRTISNVILPAMPHESTRTLSPAPSFTSDKSHDADDLSPTEPSFEAISSKARTSVKGKSCSAKRYKRAAATDPVEIFLIGNIQKNIASKWNSDDPDDLICRIFYCQFGKVTTKEKSNGKAQNSTISV